MFDLDKWQEILGTIKKNRLRTFLTAFSVAWGIFILIVVLAAGEGLKNGAKSQFGNDANNAIWIEGGMTSLPFEGYKTGREVQLTNADYFEIKDHTNGVEIVSAMYRPWESKVLSYKNEHVSFTTRAVAPDHCILENVKILAGRFINQIDFDECRKVCAMGLPVKKVLFKAEDPINKYIDVAGTKYKVVGLFDDAGRGDNERIYIPLVTSQRINNGQNKIHTIWAGTGKSTVEESEVTAKKIREKLAKKYHFNVEDMNAVGIYNNNVSFKRVMGLLDGIKLFVFIIGVLTLMAGIVGVSNIMMIVVKERTKEIGVRKALGATPFSIVTLIILESVFITFIAGYIGLMSGIGLIELAKTFKLDSDFFQNPDVDLSIAITSVVLIIVAGALAGLFPALKAARVQPITALRED
jgi:putative ABC transport system permease protein